MDVPQFIAGRFRIECEIGLVVWARCIEQLTWDSIVRLQSKSSSLSLPPIPMSPIAFCARRARWPNCAIRYAAMIFDAGNLPDGRHFIIMEFVEGTTLSEALARDGRFSAERAVKIAVQICEVLDEAHRLGIIHRDLKPSNIMLNERGVCVLDFGVAKVLVNVRRIDSHTRHHWIGPDNRHAAVHVAGAVPGPTRGSAQRSL